MTALRTGAIITTSTPFGCVSIVLISHRLRVARTWLVLTLRSSLSLN